MPEYVDVTDLMNGKVSVVFNEQPLELLTVKKSNDDGYPKLVFTFAALGTIASLCADPPVLKLMGGLNWSTEDV